MVPPNDGKFFYITIEEDIDKKGNNYLEKAAISTHINVGIDKFPFKASISTTAYNLGLDSFIRNATKYDPTISSSAFNSTLKMTKPHNQVGSLYDENSFPYHYRFF